MNVDFFRSLLAITEHGSLNRAADQLRVSQSTLTRQMQALEGDVGGKLLERTSSGVALTAAGHVLVEKIRPVLAQMDAVLEEVRRMNKGQSEQLRIGYLMSAAAEYLHPALLALKKTHPEVKAKLHDLTPGEQIAWLRRGDLDVAIMGQAGEALGNEFYLRKFAASPVYVALAETHPLATQPSVRLSELRGQKFIGADDADMPGHNAWVKKVCRTAGFRVSFTENAESVTDSFAMILTDGAVGLFPEYHRKTRVAGVVFRRLAERKVTWDLYVAWQRGRASNALRTFVDALKSSASSGENAN